MTPNRLGLVVGAAFGLAYVLVNAGPLPSPVGALLRVLAILAFAGVLVALRGAAAPPASDGATRPRFGRGYLLVVAAEVAAFAGGNALLNGPLDLPRGVLGWISFVVGVHFLGLAGIWNEPSLRLLGIAIAALGALGLGVAAAGGSEAAVAAVAGVGPGALLLAGSLWGARSPHDVSTGGRPSSP
jgi:hypothetical protein